jgi:hypothetical protein
MAKLIIDKVLPVNLPKYPKNDEYLSMDKKLEII